MQLTGTKTSLRDGGFYSRYRFLFIFYLWFVGLVPLLLPSTSFALTGLAGDLAPRDDGETTGPDGQLTAADVIVLQRIVLGVITPTAEELLVGDVAPVGNPDGVLDMADVLVLQRAVLGLVTLPPIDTGPPEPIDPALVTVGDAINGQVSITGAPNSIPVGGSVTVTNTSTGELVTVSANADGSFTAQIAGLGGDNLAIVARNRTGDVSDAAGFEVARPATFSALALSIAQPLSDSTINQTTVQVSGTFEGPVGTGITVNGAAAEIIGLRFFAEISLSTGTNTIVVTATTPDGSTVSSSVNVTASESGASPIQVSMDPPNGIGFAPLDVYFYITSTNGQPIQRIQLDADNNGTMDLDSTRGDIYLGDWFGYGYYIPGVYKAKLTVTLASGDVHVSFHTIIVTSFDNMDTMLRSIFNSMLASLSTGNIEGAVGIVAGGMQDRYRSVFTALQNDLPNIVSQVGDIQGGTIGEDMAEYVLTREENGQKRAYFIYFLRGEDGVWRIEGM